jgi:hypothetical protein
VKNTFKAARHSVFFFIGVGTVIFFGPGFPVGLIWAVPFIVWYLLDLWYRHAETRPQRDRDREHLKIATKADLDAEWAAFIDNERNKP